ncbi:MAG: PAS-domain containing protein, partial [Parvularculaceae bacterium]|nr:PAS-domain containing protein [Parvularculaceae bacterium]
MAFHARDARAREANALERRIAALSPRRLGLLTAGFIAALAALLFVQMRQEQTTRRIETELRVDAAAARCANKADIAILAGADMRTMFAECHPGGLAAVYYFDAQRAIKAVFGASEAVHFDGDDARNLPFGNESKGVVAAASGRLFASWRVVDGGGLVVVAGPREDLFARTPVWVAIAVVVGALMTAFVRQSRIASEAAGAVKALREMSTALAAGRASPWRYDPDARAVSFSRALLEPLGLGARDRVFSLREISALVHPEDLRTALAVFVGEPGDLNEGAARFRDPNGGWSRLYLRTAPGRADEERTGFAFDLSTARAQSPAVVLAETRLKDAIESIPEAFVLWDAQGRLAVWNRRFAALFRMADKGLEQGLSCTEVWARAGDRAEFFGRYFAVDAAAADQSMEAALPGDRWIHISRRRTAEGGLVCIASNVTDMRRRARAQKRKERELERLVADLEASRAELSETMRKYRIEKRRAEDANRSKSEFLAKMSHELRTPLNAINGFSEIMQAELYGPLGDRKYKEYVEDILSSGRHLLALIDDILDMSKIETGRVELEPKRLDLDRLVKECVRLVSRRAQEVGVAIDVSVASAPAIFADARAAKQVLLRYQGPGGTGGKDGTITLLDVYRRQNVQGRVALF